MRYKSALKENWQWATQNKIPTLLVFSSSVIATTITVYAAVLVVPILATKDLQPVFIRLQQQYAWFDTILQSELGVTLVSYLNYFATTLTVLVLMIIIATFIVNMLVPMRTWHNYVRSYLIEPMRKLIKTSITTSIIVGIFSFLGGTINNFIANQSIAHSGVGAGAISGMVAATITTSIQTMRVMLSVIKSPVKAINRNYKEIFTKNENIMGFMQDSNDNSPEARKAITAKKQTAKQTEAANAATMDNDNEVAANQNVKMVADRKK